MLSRKAAPVIISSNQQEIGIYTTESIALCSLRGLIGIVFGIIASELLSRFAEWPKMTSPAAIVGAFLLSLAVGIFFGFDPARKSAALDPIDVLRYE